MVRRKLKGSILLTVVGILALFLGVLYFELQGFVETLSFTKQAKEKETCLMMVDVMREYAKKNKKAKELSFDFEQGHGKVVIKKNTPPIFEYTITLKGSEFPRVYREYFSKE